MTKKEARSLTEKIKANKRDSWELALRVFEGEGWKDLGDAQYDSWGEYWEHEFEEDSSRGYQYLDAARVNRVFDSNMFESRPANERQMRALTTLRSDEKLLIQAWELAQELARDRGTRVTATIVKEAVGLTVKPWEPRERIDRMVKQTLEVHILLSAKVGDEEDDPPTARELKHAIVGLQALRRLVNECLEMLEAPQKDIDSEFATILEQYGTEE